jgi:hypothetical protein
MTLIKNLYEIFASMEQTIAFFFLKKNQKLGETSFLILKYSGDSEKFCFRLIFFLFKFACRKNRENLHFFFTDRQNWNTLSRFLCQVFFIANWEERVPRKRQFSKSGTFYPIFFNSFFKFFSATFVTFWIGIIF